MCVFRLENCNNPANNYQWATGGPLAAKPVAHRWQPPVHISRHSCGPPVANRVRQLATGGPLVVDERHSINDFR
jgi:hypothetical protein